MYKYDIFLKLCDKGKKILDFKNTKGFFEFVKDNHNDKDFLNDLNKIKIFYQKHSPFLQKTMRMTILEMF